MTGKSFRALFAVSVSLTRALRNLVGLGGGTIKLDKPGLPTTLVSQFYPSCRVTSPQRCPGTAVKHPIKQSKEEEKEERCRVTTKLHCRVECKLSQKPGTSPTCLLCKSGERKFS